MIPLISRQLMEFFLSGLTGVGLGILYDIFRALRRKRKGWTPPLDLLFALVFFLSLLLTSVYTRGLKLYQCLGFFLGSCLYFLTVSPPLLKLLGKLLSLFGCLRRYAGNHLKKSLHFLRKLEKKFFSTWKKWSTIDAIPFFRRIPFGNRHKASHGTADSIPADPGSL